MNYEAKTRERSGNYLHSSEKTVTQNKEVIKHVSENVKLLL